MAKAKKKTTKKIGRPKGAKTTQKPVQTVDVSTCPRCKSTQRTEYRQARPPLVCVGLSPSGQPYTSVHWRICTCRNCGQVRIDKEYRNEN